jgi:hypothetical protein
MYMKRFLSSFFVFYLLGGCLSTFSIDPACLALKKITPTKAEGTGKIQTLISLVKSPAQKSRKKWEKFYREWQETALSSIKGSLKIYQEAKAAGHPHVLWMESMGFVFGPSPKDVRVPSLKHILIEYLQKLGKLVEEGRDPDSLIFPTRVVYLPEPGLGDKSPNGKNFITVNFGEEIPEGHEGSTHLFPLSFHLRSMSDGNFPMGEPAPLITEAVKPYVTFLIHDITHLELFMSYPDLMPSFRSAAKVLVEKKAAFPKSSRGWPDSAFSSEHVDFLRQKDLLNQWVARKSLKPGFNLTEASADVVAKWLNTLPSETRLTLHTVYVTHFRNYDSRLKAGLRYHYVLESSSLLTERSAKELERKLKSENLLPSATKENYYTAKEIKAHLLARGKKAVYQANELMVEMFPKHVIQYGASSRDVVQNPLRFEASAPTGNSHFATMEYLHFKASRARKSDSEFPLEDVADNVSKLAAAAIASGKVDIHGWLTNVASPPEKGSPLDIWLNKTGAFNEDDYWFSYQPEQ